MRIALFVTCLADGLFPQVGQATVRLLERLGHEVTFPQAQTCCGQMHTNTGYLRQALPLVRRYVDVFENCDVVVVPSGSCTGSVRHQHAMVARRFGDEARDLEVFLQLLPRSSTGERMNPYTSMWTGVTPGGRPAALPPGPAGQRPDRRAGRPGRAGGAALHPVFRVPERVPGV